LKEIIISVRDLGSNIISLAKYWYLKKEYEFQANLHLILLPDILLLLMLVLESHLDLVLVEGDWSGGEIELQYQSLLGY
jgi:hypothetical protein